MFLELKTGWPFVLSTGQIKLLIGYFIIRKRLLLQLEHDNISAIPRFPKLFSFFFEQENFGEEFNKTNEWPAKPDTEKSNLDINCRKT